MVLYLLGVLLAGLFILLAKGPDPRGFEVWVWISILLTIPCYFMAKRKFAPTRMERVLARVWVALRRFVCFSAALIFGAGAVFALFSIGKPNSLLAVCIFTFFALLFAWWGVFGAGEWRSFGDDVPSHTERKKRYGWK